jgi:hypothetical protein
MIDHNGWFGDAAHLYQTLRSFGCDRSPDGKFRVDGPITSFMGAGEEFVVGSDAVYYVGGKARNLIAALGATSYGRQVVVI